MASFNAVLTFEGQQYPIDICTQHMQQTWDHHGRPASKVTGGELSITMPVPAGTHLLAWTRNPTLARPCQMHFSSLDNPFVGMVLALEKAYCVSYAEHFEPDATGRVAYYVQLSIVAEKIDKHGTTFDNRWTPTK